jgi:hypothetical protein
MNLLRIAFTIILVLTGFRAQAALELAQDRTTHFVGEKILLNLTGSTPVKVELVTRAQRLPVFQGQPGAVVLDTTWLAPGQYEFAVNGNTTGKSIVLAPVIRRSPGALADEAHPTYPNPTKDEAKNPELRAANLAQRDAALDARLRELNMTAAFGMMAVSPGRMPVLDVMARTGVLSFNNPETRPTSFLPVANNPVERDGLVQRMLLTAQANGRYPNFAGFCVAFDSTGFTVGGRRMLLVYWKWGNATDALRQYLARNDELLTGEFKQRTGYAWVTPEEYIQYTLAIHRPDMAPVIDLPTHTWMNQISSQMPALEPSAQAAFEKRLDAWAAWLMSQYPSTYAYYQQHLRAFDPTLRQTGSVQIDHGSIINGQYIPAAYAPLDFRYQSTWNDQFGAPDYIYQPLFTAGMLDTERPDGQPVWISNAHGFAHGRSPVPGKVTRVAAHILAHGGSGVGNAMEAFSTMLGGLSHHTGPDAVMDIQSGREFTERFASLALGARGDYGVGILLSKAQFSRQYGVLAYGTPQFRAFVSLTKMGYTPVFLTDDEIAAKNYRGVKALVVFGQSVPLPTPVLEGLKAFHGPIICDGGTSVEVGATHTLDLTLPLRNDPGRPHNWDAPVEDATFLFAKQHRQLAPLLEAALAGKGRGWLRTDSLDLTLQQIDGGEAKYVVASNDTFVKTQADWRELSDRVIPAENVTGFLYDLTDEKLIGEVKPFACDLTKTTARVFGIFPREVSAPDVKCRQNLATGETLPVRVAFNVTGVVPFYLSVIQPDGAEFFGGYRATKRDGTFTIELRLPANAPVGAWKVQARSQLDGQLTTVPVTVSAGKPPVFAVPLREPVVVREKAVIEQVLTRGATVTLPVFKHQSQLLPVAEAIRAKLQTRGVTVNIVHPPVVTNYFVAYALTDDQAAVNKLVESGKAIGQVKRLTVNQNDWFGDSKYRTGGPVILLDVTGVKDNDLAESFDLWPQPPAGGAVVQGIAWAFGPRHSAVVISAADVTGLRAAAERLTTLPEDFLTASVREARAGLLRELHIGGTPTYPAVEGVTATGATVSRQPVPFVMKLGNMKPYPADQAPIPPAENDRVVTLPALPVREDFTAKVRSGDGYVSAYVYSATMDLRFNHALELRVNVPQAGPVAISADGIFRYSDRVPMTAAQWEDVLAIRAKYYKPGRQPMRFDVYVDGQLAGKLDQSATGEREVQIELTNPSGGKPRTQMEEVVTSLAGTINLPAGEHKLLFVHHNIVDGQMSRLRLGLSVAEADAIEAERKAAAEAEKQRQAAEKKK